MDPKSRSVGGLEFRWKGQLILIEGRNGSEAPKLGANCDDDYTNNRLCTTTFVVNYYPTTLLIDILQ
jgi:hypothetical protein